VHQRDGIGSRPLPGALHQPGDGRPSVSTRGWFFVEANMDEHARQGARRDSELLGLASKSLVIGFVQTHGDRLRHACMVPGMMQDDALCIIAVPQQDWRVERGLGG
jgi:hypothetical protein